MRRISTAALTVLMAFSLMLSVSTSASANAIAGGGWSSSYSGESVFTNLGPGASGQFSAIFFNDGNQTWAPGVVGLLICAADKVTCNVASPNAAYASGWTSSTVYATVTASVAPGQNGFFIYNFVVPAGTPAGTAATFNGDVGLIASGLELRPQGYYQINTTPSGTGGLTLSPASASMAVGATQQFTASGAAAGATITWSVTGGCGAVTNAGLFAATATNSATQPCSVNAASSDGLSASAPITVFGPVSQIACSANPSTTVANGSNTIVVTATLKDANGNTVSNASSPTLTFNNVTPNLITPAGSQAITPSAGVASATYTTTTATGNAQVSVSGGTLTGCNAIVATSAPGTATKTSAALNRNPIAADGASTSVMTVSILDANGNTVISDNTTVLTATRDSNSANVCSITAVPTGTGASFSAGSGSATAVNGVVQFTLTAQTTPGSCIMAITTSNTAIAGTSATLTTQLTGAPNKLAIGSNTGTAPATTTNGTCTKANFAAGTITDNGCIIVRVLVQDVNGNRVTGPSGSVVVTAALDANTCTGAGGGNVNVASATDTASSGRATFAFNSAGAYSGCSVTFSSPNLTSVTTTMVWTAGGADHLTCAFSPIAIVNDASSTSNATVRVRDQLGNTVTTGSYSVTFSRNSGTSTTLLTSNPQTTSGGSTTYTVKSTTTTGTDNYGAAITSGSTPTLPLVVANGTCNISVQTTVP
jgi:adhesin/invasin